VRSLLGGLIGGLRNDAPVPYVGRGMAGGRDRRYRADQVAEMEAMGASATLFAIVNRTSTSVAKETWHLGRARPDATCDVCDCQGHVNVEKHPALSLLARPNPFYTTQEFFESGQQHVDLTGEGWTVIERFGRMPGELWVARPDRMVVVTDQQEFLLGYIYVDPDGAERPLLKDDVLSIRMPNPMDPYRGMGAVQTVLANIDAGGYSAEWNANFFKNGARPGGIVKLSRKMLDGEFNQLVERFNQNHRGTANANRTAFLEDGDWVDVKPMTMRDMEFTETSNLNRDTILLAFGMSKFAVGVVEDVNRATADASATWFGETATVPRLDRWRGMLNNDLLPQYPGTPGELKFYYSNPVPADREADRDDKASAAEVYSTLVLAGVDPVDAAEVAGLPPMRTVAPPKQPVPAGQP
jgi:HK97 family phage portal protein